MKTTSAISETNRRNLLHVAGSVKLVFLVVIVFLAGAAVGMWWHQRKVRIVTQESLSQSESESQATSLSDASKSLLGHLTTPVEVRFYIKQDLKQLPASLRSFAGRADQLVSEFERASAGKLRVSREDPMTVSAAKPAAKADGIQPIDTGDGDLCYLGLTVSCGGRKEVLPQLLPEWEAALESDFARAIARVVAGAKDAKPPVQVVPIDPAISNEVARAFPDLPVISLQEGTQILRDAALEQFKTAAAEMQSRVKEAEQKLSELVTAGSDADKEAARKNLQKVQSEQTEKLKEITQRLQTQITVLEQLKASIGTTGKTK